MEARYNVYFAGELSAGHDLASVREQLARLFKADTATLDKLFSGKAQLVKRDCDRDTALKYKQAMEQAGAVPFIKSIAQPAASAPAAGKALSMAERIAALAAAPDIGYPPQAGNPTTPEAAQLQQPTETGSVAGGGIQLAPPGTAVLLPQERPAPATSTVTPPPLTGPNANYISYLVAVARKEIVPTGLPSLANNLTVVEILDAAHESARTGKRVELK